MIAKKLAVAMVLAALILAVAASLRYAQGVGTIEPDTARRTMQVLIGLGLAAYANLMPKQVARGRRSPRAEARMQAVLRVGGWSLTLAGLAYAGLWAAAPIAFADTASVVVIVAALAITLGFALRAGAKCIGSAEETNSAASS